MNNSEKIFESKHLIRFADCDPFNHLNNARYLDYFINAREDHIRIFQNFNIYEYAAQSGKSWVVSRNQIAYLKPAFMMEEVIISSTILALREKDILVEMMMWDNKKSRLKSIMWSNFVHVDLKTQKPVNHDEALISRFKALENSTLLHPTFEQRLESLKNNKA